ncbi:MAG: N-glycosylase/DNA lyase [Nanoarchaeota archaeon]|nr:N-glycosylase/DNA lyase [Nanoarchaeota archaeon]
MVSLIKQIKSLQKSHINNKIEQRIEEFKSFKNKSQDKWYSELCFCILAANSKQKTSEAIQRQLGARGFLTKNQKQLSQIILKNKHRFHNNKAKYLIELRAHPNIKHTITQQLRDRGIIKTREWLVNNVKGIGYKEASHFLRNTGTTSLAILDRHILNVMKEHNIIDEIPKLMNRNNYLEIEKKFYKLSGQLNMSPAKLDLFMWYMKTGEVAK